MKRWSKYHFPAILWMLIIFVQSSFPSITLPKVELFEIDKLVHMGVYGLLAALIYISLIHQNNFSVLSQNPVAWTIILTALYGASDEFHQTFVPNRSGELPDLLADIIGALLSILIIKYFLSAKISFLSRKDNISKIVN